MAEKKTSWGRIAVGVGVVVGGILVLYFLLKGKGRAKMEVIGSTNITNKADSFGGAVVVMPQNPASKNFTITTVKLYLHNGIPAGQHMTVGTCYSVGVNKFTARDYAQLNGPVPAGYSEHAVSIQAQSGDYFVIWIAGTVNGTVDMEATGAGPGVWHSPTATDPFPFTDKSFNWVATWGDISAGGEGYAAAGGGVGPAVAATALLT